MRLGVLFSGGKDSVFAMYKAMQSDEVVCLITVIAENKESYMFHTPNIGLTRVQAEALGLPIIIELTKGEKEEELKDLERAIRRAKREYRLDGIVTGALASVYQSGRIQKICDDLEIKCVNPLWQTNQTEHLKSVVNAGFEVLIVGVFARGLEHLLGKKLNKMVIDELEVLERKHRINPAGEGGEIETFVLDGPIFKKRIVIKDVEIGKEVYTIKDAGLADK